MTTAAIKEADAMNGVDATNNNQTIIIIILSIENEHLKAFMPLKH